MIQTFVGVWEKKKKIEKNYVKKEFFIFYRFKHAKVKFGSSHLLAANEFFRGWKKGEKRNSEVYWIVIPFMFQGFRVIDFSVVEWWQMLW